MKKSMTTIAFILATTTTFPVFALKAPEENPTASKFTRLDANHDGYLSKAEIEAQPVLTRYMEVSTYGSFELGDINSDGLLNKAEFMTIEEVLPAE